jgi:hypothetical protein
VFGETGTRGSSLLSFTIRLQRPTGGRGRLSDRSCQVPV